MRLRNIPRAEGVLETSPYVIKNETACRGKWNEIIFKNSQPIHIEIGMGKGQFLLTLAKHSPDINYIGIERYSSVLLRAVEKLESPATPQNSRPATDPPVTAQTSHAISQNSRPVTDPPVTAQTGIPASDTHTSSRTPAPDNLRFICMDAADIEKVFAPGEVSRIYLNFSDPWPKARHARRRLTSPEYLARYSHILESNGQLEFKTDNQNLFTYSEETLKSSGTWTITALTRDLQNTPSMSIGNTMTEYEEKFSSLGNPICKLIANIST